MMGKWNFFVPSEEGKEKKSEKEKVPNKFLGWMSSLLKKKTDEPLSLNLSTDQELDKIKQELVDIPEGDRAEAEQFLATKISEIEKSREAFNPELGEEVSFKGSREWFISDVKNGRALFEIRRSRKDPKGRDVLERNIVRSGEISAPQDAEVVAEVADKKVFPETTPESFANKFKLEEKVVFAGDAGWRVKSIAGHQVEIGKLKKDPKGRDSYESKIVSDEELEADASVDAPELKKGDSVSVKGEAGWEVVSVAAKGGEYLEVGKVRADKKGTLIFERKIVEAKEVEREK